MKKLLAIVTAIILILGCNPAIEATQSQDTQTKEFKLNIGGQVEKMSLVKINNVWYIPVDVISKYSNYELKIDEKNGTIVVRQKTISDDTAQPQYDENLLKVTFNEYVKDFLFKCGKDKNKYYSRVDEKDGAKKPGWTRIKFKVRSRYSTKVEKASTTNSQYIGTFTYYVSISVNQVCNTKALADKNNNYSRPEEVVVRNTYVYQQGKWTFQLGKQYINKYNTWVDSKTEYYMNKYTKN